MLRAPHLALDLPLRLLIWEQRGQILVSHQSPAYVARRFGIALDLPAHAEARIGAALAR